MIDTHAHILNEYYDDIDKVINNMKDNIIIISGTNDSDNIEVIKLCNKYKNVYGTIGIHPEEIDNMTSDSYKIIEENLSSPKIVGIGEIGLDYHYTKDNKEKQKEVFINQLNLAKKYNKPVVVHSRDAIADTYEILKKYKELKKDIHCFSGSLEMAKEFIKINCRLGIGGVLTFKNSKLSEVIKQLPIDSFLLETDSPFLTPEPFRGDKNEPYNIIYVAKKIAEIKGISLEKVLEITKNNAICQFDLDKKMC